MSNTQKIIIGVAVGAVIVVVGYQLYQPSFTPTPELAEPAEVATSTSQVPFPLAPQEANDARPTITLTPYTVYLGGATAFGTSSPLLMGQELGQVVIGYEWESVNPSPMFDSISLPQWDPADTNSTNTYQVYVWDEEVSGYILLGAHTVGKEIQFPRDELNGPRKFKVLGIDPALRICPGDRSFTWSSRFTYPAPMSIVRTPIVQALPVPETCRMR